MPSSIVVVSTNLIKINEEGIKYIGMFVGYSESEGSKVTELTLQAFFFT